MRLRLVAARPEEAGRGIARLAAADMDALGLSTGEVVAIAGRRAAHARALPAGAGGPAPGAIAVDGATRGNAGAGLGDAVEVTRLGEVPAARRLRLAAAGPRPAAAALRRALAGLPLAAGDALRVTLPGGAEARLTVAATEPAGPVLADAATEIALDAAAPAAAAGAASGAAQGVRYEEIGGLSRVVARIREVVEWPLRRPEAFAALGIAPPRGVLLVGPPGTGKTLIARAVATESGAAFHAINGPEVVDRYYGASEGALRAVFEAARRAAPSVVFIDEIDAIAPRRDGLSGEKQVERRIVAQLLTLMDGLADPPGVVVLAATNRVAAVDPALRRPGRFDLVVEMPEPDAASRRAILGLHAGRMALAPDVALDALAEATAGFVGADLAGLCRRAALAAMARAPEPEAAVVAMADFAAALAAEREARAWRS